MKSEVVPFVRDSDMIARMLGLPLTTWILLGLGLLFAYGFFDRRKAK